MHNINKIILTLLTILCTAQIRAAPENTNSFSTLCAAFREAQTHSTDELKMSAYVNQVIKQRLSGTDAGNVMSAVVQLPPGERYAVIKESAEYSLGIDWDCKEMKSLMKSADH